VTWRRMKASEKGKSICLIGSRRESRWKIDILRVQQCHCSEHGMEDQSAQWPPTWKSRRGGLHRLYTMVKYLNGVVVRWSRSWWGTLHEMRG